MSDVRCWRCDRKVAEVREPGGVVAVTCKRCQAVNVISEKVVAQA